MKAFGRVAEITVIGQTADVFSPFKGADAANAVKISKFRIRFDLKKNLGKNPNKCVIKIDGLAPVTRAQLEVKPLRVILHAGYGDNLKLLFDGDMRRAYSEREGTQVITEMHVADGGRALSTARLERSYGRAVSLRQIVKDCADSLQMEVPPEVIKSRDFDQRVSEFSSSGLTRDALATVLNRFNYGFSVQNRQLVVLRADQIREGQEYLVNQSSGLVHSPKLKESEHAGKGSKTEITFTHLLYPELVPGVRVRVESESIHQSIKVTDSDSKGDTHSSGEDWVTEVKGVPVT